MTAWFHRNEKWLAALFFAALIAVGLLTCADYGQPWDEPWEQDILRMNVNQYAAVFGSSARLPLLSSVEKPESGLIADSIERDHGECAYYPVAWLVSASGLSECARMTLWHGYTWLLFCGGAAALWLICRHLRLSRLLSSAAALMLVLSPRFFAEGHYNNKDIVLAVLVLTTLWLALRLMERPTFARGVLFSLAGAAAANTKVIGLFVWGLCALAVLARQLAAHRMSKRVWAIAAATIAAFGVCYALLTPALIADPTGFLRYAVQNAASFARWENDVLFRGTVFRLVSEKLPRYYLPYMIAVTTPLWVLALIAWGHLAALGRLVKEKTKFACSDVGITVLLCVLLWLVPLGFAVLSGATVYNGWRHFYFLYGPMLAVAAFGLQRLAELLRPHRTARRIGAAALALCMVFSGVQLTLLHPNQFAYYNELTSRHDVEGYLELDYWNVSVLETLERLTDEQEGELRVCGADLWSQTGLENNAPLLSDPSRVIVLSESDPSADYVLSNATYAVIGGWQPSEGMRVVCETRAGGEPLMRVWTRKEAQP